MPTVARHDRFWVLAALYGSIILLTFPFQYAVWQAMASDVRPTLQGVLVPVAFLHVLIIGGMVVAAWLAPASSEIIGKRVADALCGRERRLIIAAAVLAVLGALSVAFFGLDAFPNSGDEYAYLFQARQFARGRLWAEAPPLGYAFVPYRTWISGGKWLSQYPPGWPLALALALRASVPAWAVNSLLAGAALACFAGRSWRWRNASAAALGILLCALTPFYLLNAGSYHSHALSACLIAALCLCCLDYRERGGVAPLVAAGVLLGLIGLTRYFSLVPLAPALLYWLLVEIRERRVQVAATMLIGALPFLALLLVYQDFVTGSPLHSTYAVIAETDESWTLTPYEFLRGLAASAYRLVELGLWTSPMVPLLYLFCLLAKWRTRSLAFYDLVFPGFVLSFVFFSSLGGNRYGPRYYFDALPLMLATIVSGSPIVLRFVHHHSQRKIAVHAGGMTLAYLLVATPFALAVYHAQVKAREEPYRIAAALGLNHAIVVLKATSGPGLLAADLARNDAKLDDPVLYARDDVAASTLAETFPGRSIWIYERDDPRRPGRLTPEHVGVATAP